MLPTSRKLLLSITKISKDVSSPNRLIELWHHPNSKDVKHVLTHRILLADFYLLETDGRFLLPADYIWIKESEFDQCGIPRLIEILLEKLRKWESE